MRRIVRWLLSTLTILAVPYLVSGVEVDGFGTALLAALLLGLLNVTLKPILILLTLPLTLFTLGFFLLIVNAIVFEFAGAILPGLHVANFGSAFLAALFVSLVNWILNLSIQSRDGRRVILVHTDRTQRSSGERPFRDLN